MNQRILIAEDEPKLLAILCNYFESKGDTPIPAKDGLEALALAESREFDGVLLALRLFLLKDAGAILAQGHGADLGGGLDM